MATPASAATRRMLNASSPSRAITVIAQSAMRSLVCSDEAPLPAAAVRPYGSVGRHVPANTRGASARDLITPLDGVRVGSQLSRHRTRSNLAVRRIISFTHATLDGYI